MEACKLSASKSTTSRLKILKRDKKCLKKLGAWEKQKNKMHEDIALETRKILDLQQQMVETENAAITAEKEACNRCHNLMAVLVVWVQNKFCIRKAPNMLSPSSFIML